MRPRLGLVCITSSDLIRYRRMTRTRFRQLEASGALPEVLKTLYEENLARLARAVTYCVEHKIRLYRVTSHLFPFSDEPFGREILRTLEPRVAAVGQRINEVGLRLVVHPDQFVVLSSDTPHVVANSITIVEHHALILDLLQQPRSAWATIILHGGKGGRADRLVEVTGGLSEAARTRLALENDERAYGAAAILDVCRRAGLPMVFDAHHHLVHDRLTDYDDPSIAEYLAAARETWPDPAWQIVHISNGRTALADPHHSDVIHTMPAAFRDAPWIEVEAKAKEVAIEQLRATWLRELDGPARTG